MTASADYVDGNALAGPLSELFAVDITSASTRCVGCGSAWSVAQLHVFASGIGTVARCPGCDAAVLRYARTPSAAIIDFRGTFVLTVHGMTAT